MLSALALLALSAFFVCGNHKSEILRATAKECQEKNLCLDADLWKCVACDPIAE